MQLLRLSSNLSWHNLRTSRQATDPRLIIWAGRGEHLNCISKSHLLKPPPWSNSSNSVLTCCWTESESEQAMDPGLTQGGVSIGLWTPSLRGSNSPWHNLRTPMIQRPVAHPPKDGVADGVGIRV
eukprot:CAMPEP_0196660190 /NCGR_PEP_ID=MMETSP1086-20130531/38588_1 /TAXON_ID=77921 /ORGANISM="Cyanoptyche  gloeocystis , Strain SAG4.97" /LENGTH=124 /DNA_ID=CAMNT_0041994487 /DNA_START=219 /DNA_END=593 /DNA_ORIENTATION=-